MLHLELVACSWATEAAIRFVSLGGVLLGGLRLRLFGRGVQNLEWERAYWALETGIRGSGDLAESVHCLSGLEVALNA